MLNYSQLRGSSIFEFGKETRKLKWLYWVFVTIASLSLDRTCCTICTFISVSTLAQKEIIYELENKLQTSFHSNFRYRRHPRVKYKFTRDFHFSLRSNGSLKRSRDKRSSVYNDADPAIITKWRTNEAERQRTIGSNGVNLIFYRWTNVEHLPTGI